MKLLAQCSGTIETKNRGRVPCRFELHDDAVTNVDEASNFIEACQQHSNEMGHGHTVRIIGETNPQ